MCVDVSGSRRATLPSPGTGAPAAGASSSGCPAGLGVTWLASLLPWCSYAALRTTKLCCSCAKIKVFCTVWTCINLCIYSEGSGQWWRKTPRKCSNSLGPGDMFYCVLAGCTGLSKTEALKWFRGAASSRLCTHGVSHSSTLQQQLLSQSMSELSLPTVHLETSSPFYPLETR